MKFPVRIVILGYMGGDGVAYMARLFSHLVDSIAKSLDRAP